MSKRPIIFSGEMVRAIKGGKKTQTRRVVKPQGPLDVEYSRRLKAMRRNFAGPIIGHPEIVDRHGEIFPGDLVYAIWGDDWHIKCPYGQPGDRLWVRETFRPHEEWMGSQIPWLYRADYGEHADELRVEWKPSIHMPRAACRLELEVVSVRVERVQDITDADAVAEGIDPNEDKYDGMPVPKANFSRLWDDINGKRNGGIYSWDANPWVWVIKFKRIK